MKLLAIVPNPASAYGLGAMLAGLPPGSTRVVAYGQATAAVLPPGLDVFVYPVRDGTRLPAPFLDALIEHEGADALIAPAGCLTEAPVPTLLIDLDPLLAPPPLSGGDDPASWTWVEGITPVADRRSTLLRAGLFSVDVLPDWFEGSGRLRATAGSALFARMTDLAGLLGRRRETARLAAPANAVQGPEEALEIELPAVKSKFQASEAGSGARFGPQVPPAPSTPRVVPIEVRGADGAVVAGDATPMPGLEGGGPTGGPGAAGGPGAGGRPPSAHDSLLVSGPLPVYGPGLSTGAAAAAAVLAPPEPAASAIGLPPSLAPVELEPQPAAVAVPEQPPEAFRGRHAGGRVVLLVGGHGLDQLSAAHLTESAVIAVPEVLPWLAARMGLAHYVCLTAPPRRPEVTAALAGSVAVLVHDDRLLPSDHAPHARAAVGVRDLQRAGGPALGWSDDLKVGFFPVPGDAALALQWAHWLGVSEVIIAGLDAADAKPGWSPFLRGVRELFEGRGITVTVLEPTPR